jgi:rhamnulokinase
MKGRIMANNKVYLAVDLGASSGRVVAGVYDGAELRLEEVHRFPSSCQNLVGHDYWNILQIFGDVKEGIRKAVQKYGQSVRSLAVDTWGVDYAYIDQSGQMLGLPYQYRDPRTKGMHEEMCSRVPKDDIYKATGIQFLFLNTSNQIMSEVVNHSPQLAAADHLLFIPDLINYWLTGVKGNERTIASTSQLWSPRTGDWDKALIEQLGMRPEVFGKIIEPCTGIGGLLPAVKEEIGQDVNVVAAASHDTGSAVAATPLTDADSAYLSSGTWSLMGVETREPIINETTLALNFTNEAGIDGTIRLLKNISGLWLFEECRRAWADEGRNYDYGAMVKLAEEAAPFSGYIDPDDEVFIEAGGMPERIRTYCRQHGKPVPKTDGEVLRTALEGIAFKYRDLRNHIESLTGKAMSSLHIVGGGSRNGLLNQLAADAINRPVIAGPVEATSCGNVLCQMIADGELDSLESGRALVKRSFTVQSFEPIDPDKWDEAEASLR